MARLIVLLFMLLVGCGDDSDVGDDLNQSVATGIITGPFDVSSYEGGTTAFSISAVGSELRYQWYRAGIPVSGATGAQLEVAAVQENAGVLYNCIVTNSKNESKSSVAVKMTLLVPPVIERNGGMVKIVPGTDPFVMGSSSSEAVGVEGPVHLTILKSSFWMDSVPVSESQYYSIMKKFCPTTHYAMPWGTAVRSSFPATSISWNDAVLYTNALNRIGKLDSSTSYRVFITLDSSRGVLNLADSLLTYKRFAADTTVSVVVQDSIAIVPADTTDSIVVRKSLVGTDTVKTKYLVRTIYPSDTVRVVPNRGYELRGVRSDGPDAKVLFDTLYVKKNEVAETLYVRHIEAGKTDAKKDTVVIDTIFALIVDTVLVAKIDSSSVKQADRFNGYRLPTEAEWEFACRARSGIDRYWGDKSLSDQYAWGFNESNNSLKPAGLKKPNLFGLYDMIGLVWEWCSDFYVAYTASEQVDPRGPAVGTRRVQRGGSYSDLPVYLRSSQRGSAVSGSRSEVVGFRVVRDAE